MNSVLGARGAMGYVLGRGAGAAAAAWWLSGGVSAANCVAAYQPIGAASLAASYSNLANPGTYDAAPGVAPTFAAATGWTFNGTTQYLTTGVVPIRATSTFIVRFSGATDGGGGRGRALIGVYSSSTLQAILGTYWFAAGCIATNGAAATDSPAISSGVLAMAGLNFYRDGSFDSTKGAGSGTFASSFYIGALNDPGGSPNPPSWSYTTGSIQAVAIYNTTLSAAQVAAISAAMAAL